MRERILGEIRKVEERFEVKVCYAVEAGSRTHGYSSKNSDYDVRFIYVHKKEWYLSIDEKRDVIELPISEQLDMSGWDVRKVLRLFRKSNPSLMEWLRSGVIYYECFSLVRKMKDLQDQVFLPESTCYHYLNMAKRNFRDATGREEVGIKNYLHVLRPILACKWIVKYLTAPPADIKELIEGIPPDGLLKQEMLWLLQGKMSGEDRKIEPKSMRINEYIVHEIEQIQDDLKSMRKEKKADLTPELNILFREIIDEAWA